MRRPVVIFVLFLSLLVQTVAAVRPSQQKKSTSSAPSAPPAKSRGIDAASIARIPGRMKSFVDQGRAAGIVTLVARRGEIVSQNAVGFQDLEKKTVMLPDTIFQIASMTKPITAVGIMILVDEGMLSITDPVQKRLPGFANIQLKERVKESDGRNAENELSEIKKPSRPITIRDLMT